MKLLYTISYTSVSDPGLTELELDALFKQVEQTNIECNIRGILLHRMDRFFQVLEGEKEVVIRLFEDKICKDTRHSDIYEVYNKPSEHPVFSSYNSKFNILKTKEDLENVKNYLNSNKSTNPTSHKLLRLLEPFMLLEEA